MTWPALHDVLRQQGLLATASGADTSAAAIAVTGIAYDSRTVRPGEVFVALRGQHADGTMFVAHRCAARSFRVTGRQPMT